MKKTALLIIVLISFYFTEAQNLVVGFTNPNEVVSLNSGTYSYDTVYIFNNGELNLSNQVEFAVNGIVALLGTSKLNVENSHFTAKNIFYMQDSATAKLSDTLDLPCSFFLTGNASVQIDSAVVNIPMTYKGQYRWVASGNAGISLNHSQCYLGYGALGGSFVDSSFFSQKNTNYYSTILPMTVGIAGNSSLTVDSCSGGMEFVISENSVVSIHASDFFVIWFTFADGDTVNYSYPAANSIVFPNASNITGNYHFSDSLPNITGVGFSVDINDADGVFWGIISKANSNVIVNNSLLIACGFYFDGITVNTASGLIDSQSYTNYQVPFSDRYFQVNNTTVKAWNFYPADSSEIIIDSCVFGESIGFVNGITKVVNSTCDGTGGYFGGTNSSKTYVFDSQIIRTGGTQQIINFQDSAKAWFYNSTVSGAAIINNNVRMYYGNCQYDSIPVVNDNAYFAEAWIDSLNNGFVDSTVSIHGKIFGINGIINHSDITQYVIQYSLPDTTNLITIKDTSATLFNMVNTELANWNTQGITSGNYLLWLTIFVDGDSAISCKRNIFLDNNTGLYENNTFSGIILYPNPANTKLTIKGKDIISVVVVDINGKEIFKGNTSEITLDKNYSGLFFVKIETAEGRFVKKLIIE